MRRGSLIGAAVIVLASLTLAGCATSVPGSEPSSPSSSASESPSPTPIVATGLVVSLEAISVVNNDGSTGDSAQFSDGAATLALLSHALGSTPPPVHLDAYGITSYDWGALSLTVKTHDGSALVVMTAPELGGLALRSTEGIEVGSTLAEVKAVASPGTEFASSATPDVYYGLEARAHPATESLTFPGRVGQDYIEVDLRGGVVVSLRTPFGDWQDV